MIQFKPLRYLGIILLLGSFAFVGGYIYYVQNSGEVLATATVTKRTPSADQEDLKINLKTYRYYDLEFEPLYFSGDMKDLKITLIAKNGGAIGFPKGLKHKLISPEFELKNKKTFQVILKRSDWITQVPNTGWSTLNTNSEGRFNDSTVYVLGHVTHPENGEYELTVKNLIFNETMLLPSRKEFYLEIKSGAIDLKIVFLLYAFSCALIGAIILGITKPKELSHKEKRKFYK